MTAALRMELSGKAIVCCVHDRQKRQVTQEAQVARLGLEAGFLYDPKQHRIHRCACCENLFVDPADVPHYCSACTRRPAHALGGPLPQPIGAVDA